MSSSPFQRLGVGLGRSLVPLCALAVLGVAIWLGPWVSLLVAYGLWRAAGRFA